MSNRDQLAALPAVLPTEEAAPLIIRRPQTLRKWAGLENGPIRPVRINGRLAWRVSDLKALLEKRRDEPFYNRHYAEGFNDVVALLWPAVEALMEIGRHKQLVFSELNQRMTYECNAKSALADLAKKLEEK